MWFLLLFALQSGSYEQGLKALDQQQYQAAVEDFTQAIAAEPGNYAAHFNLALAYSMLGNDPQAIAEFKKTLELKPKLYQAELNLGICLLRSHQPGEAAKYLEAAVEQKPKEYRPNFYLGEALTAAGEPDRARQFYMAALDADGKSARAAYGLGVALLKLDRADEAATYLREAAEIDPQLRDGLLRLAEVYEKQKRTADAVAIYKEFPENAAAREHWGELLLESGKTTDSIAALEAAVAASPTTANQTALATAYFLNKQPEKALPLAGAALKAEPNNYDLHMLEGRIFRDSHKYNDAAQEFYRAAQLRPDAVEAWSEMSVVLVLMDNYPAALTALDRVAQLHGEKPGHVYLRAIALDKMRQVKPALENYERFLALSNGQSPDEEFKARQRARILREELAKR